MPQGDKSGPMGKGARTGRGMGMCSVEGKEGEEMVMRRGMGRGRGRGKMQGRGMGPMSVMNEKGAEK